MRPRLLQLPLAALVAAAAGPAQAQVAGPGAVLWQPVAPQGASGPAVQKPPPSGPPVWIPIPGSAGAGSPGPSTAWRQVPSPSAPAGPPGGWNTAGSRSTPQPAVVWHPVPATEADLATTPAPSGTVPAQGSQPGGTGTAPAPGTPAFGPPSSLQEAQAMRQAIIPVASDYPLLLRLGQLPTANMLDDGVGQLSFQQVSPSSGKQGGGGGSGNQNYVFRADLAINSQLLVSAFYTYNDDPLYAPITVRPTQPPNLWTVGGAALRARLAGGHTWGLAAEGSIERFTVGSGGYFGNCPSGNCGSNNNIFNSAAQEVYTNNWVGSISLPISWNPVPRWQLSLTPGVSFLPATQGAGQGGAGTFFGTNVSVGVGTSYRIGDQLQLFTSALLPLGPGTNAFNGQLNFYRVPILSLGANYAVNPRIGLELQVTNGMGLTPATAILALPSSPTTPMLGGRFIWTVGALDSPRVTFTPRQRSLALGGVSVSTAVLPPDGTTTLWGNVDSLGNLFGSAAYSVSNDFAFEVAGGRFGNAGSAATGATGSAASFLDTYQGPGNVNVRFGGKAMVFRPSKTLPLWAAGRITVGRNFQSSSYQGYLFFETVNTWEATPWLAFNLNPKLAWSGIGFPWGIGLSANIQLGRSFQLIPEINAVATSTGGQNGTNGTLALRWLASPTVAIDVYAGNASGILDMGQLLGTNQLRVGGKVTVQF